MRVADLSPDRRKRLIPVAGREHINALVPPPCPRILDAIPILTALLAAEKAIAETAAVARLLPPAGPDHPQPGATGGGA